MRELCNSCRVVAGLVQAHLNICVPGSAYIAPQPRKFPRRLDDIITERLTFGDATQDRGHQRALHSLKQACFEAANALIEAKSQ